MDIRNDFFEQPLTSRLTHRFIGRDGTLENREEPVLTEHGLCVSVNGKQLDFVCLPQFLPELILGNLMTEGHIQSAADVEAICIEASGKTAAVTLKQLAAPGGLRPAVPAQWRPEWAFALADRFAEGMPVHGQTTATHSCFLAKGEQLLFQCEDIGRHNAVDKAVGFALRNGIPPEECILYSSGRMPVDMVSKALRAGIPVLISKGAPTAGSVALARQYGLTLICAARKDRMKQFSGPDWTW